MLVAYVEPVPCIVVNNIEPILLDRTKHVRLGFEPRVPTKDTLKLGIQTNDPNQRDSSWEFQIMGIYNPTWFRGTA